MQFEGPFLSSSGLREEQRNQSVGVGKLSAFSLREIAIVDAFWPLICWSTYRPKIFEIIRKAYQLAVEFRISSVKRAKNSHPPVTILKIHRII